MSAAESSAYNRFQERPVTNFSKILYLIERFESSDIQIYYDGHYYKPQVAAFVAKCFLSAHYKKETVPVWIGNWCSTSLGGERIYVKFSDGRFLLAHDVLTSEWKTLESTLSEYPPVEFSRKA